MFKHILVPLDGSRLAESVLPVARTVAQKTQATITLIHVIEKKAPERDPWGTSFDGCRRSQPVFK